MARYTGPTTRISRRFGVHLLGSAKALERRNYPPGQHGPKSRRKVSEYSVGLGEKQKLRFVYGLLERQFRRTFEIAKRERGVTGERFMQLLETRLDSVVYLLGIAKSRAAARQFVNHGHIRVNGRKLDYTATAGTLTIRDNHAKPTASVFYVAYTLDGAAPGKRPVTFLFNGGPGSSSIWLHMGSFAPMRVQTSTPATVRPGLPAFGANRDTLRELLHEQNYQFIEAPDGELALATILIENHHVAGHPDEAGGER